MYAGFRATVLLDVFYAVIQFTALEALRTIGRKLLGHLESAPFFSISAMSHVLWWTPMNFNFNFNFNLHRQLR